MPIDGSNMNFEIFGIKRDSSSLSALHSHHIYSTRSCCIPFCICLASKIAMVIAWFWTRISVIHQSMFEFSSLCHACGCACVYLPKSTKTGTQILLDETNGTWNMEHGESTSGFWHNSHLALRCTVLYWKRGKKRETFFVPKKNIFVLNVVLRRSLIHAFVLHSSSDQRPNWWNTHVPYQKREAEKKNL